MAPLQMNTDASAEKQRSEYDVAIVGAGPTGITLATLLAQQGLSVCLLERNKAPLAIPRAVHLDSETMRVFQSIGLAVPLLNVLRPGSGMQWVDARGKTLMIREGRPGIDEQGWHHDYYFHQPQLEAVLREGLQRFPNVTFLQQRELHGLHADDDRVQLNMHDLREGLQRGNETLQARFVVGCDGARSTVRRWVCADNEFEDLGEHQTWLVVDGVLHRPLRLPEHTVQHCDPARPATSIYVHPLRRRWELMLLPGEDPQRMTDPAKVWQLIAPWVKPAQATLERASTYTFHSLIAQRWQRGRVLLAGDAVHQTPPFLGQGLCAGVRDAANLAWKLSRCVQQSAPLTLLDTYGPERMPHVREFIRLAVEVGRVIQLTDVAAAAVRDEQLQHDTVRFPFPQPRLGVGVHCANEREEIVGRVAPQFQLNDGRSLDDVVRQRFVLLAAPDMDITASLPQVQALDMVLLQDASEAAWQWLRQHGAMAVILRPDGYVFDLCHSAAELQSALDTLARWLVTTPSLSKANHASSR